MTRETTHPKNTTPRRLRDRERRRRAARRTTFAQEARTPLLPGLDWPAGLAGHAEKPAARTRNDDPPLSRNA